VDADIGDWAPDAEASPAESTRISDVVTERRIGLPEFAVRKSANRKKAQPTLVGRTGAPASSPAYQEY
jgi:hypothetical protein